MNKLYVTADTVIKNGKVLTVNCNDDIAQAVAILGNKILAVGTDDEMDLYIGDKTCVIDVDGKTVMPGFIDTHIHFGMYGLLDNGIIDLTYPKVKSIEEIKNIIKKEALNKKNW